MKNLLIPVVLGSCFLFSCSNNSNDAANTESVVSPDSTSMISTPASSDAAVQMPPTDNSGAMPAPVAPASAITTPTAQPGGKTAPGMNPPHGEPGHRCEIAVGAPLNSAPAASPGAGNNITAPALSPAPGMPVASPAAPSTNSTPAPTPAGMNPPHGQPGHDCAIQVGAPLKK